MFECVRTNLVKHSPRVKTRLSNLKSWHSVACEPFVDDISETAGLNQRILLSRGEYDYGDRLQQKSE